MWYVPMLTGRSVDPIGARLGLQRLVTALGAFAAHRATPVAHWIRGLVAARTEGA